MAECASNLSAAVSKGAQLRRRVSAKECRAVLAKSHKSLLTDQTKPYGGSTASFVAITPSRGLMSGVNLGDSGWRVVRGGEVVASSSDQRHSVFTPWQLCKPWPGLEVIDDDPTHADAQDVEIQSGDVVVVATDGLYDNL